MVGRLAGAWKFTRRAWGLARPYWSSEERWTARILLVTITALTLGLVFLTVLYNDWNRAFFEAIQDKDFESFGPLLLRFGVLAALFILGAVFRRYLTLMLQMRWRIWLTRRFMDDWLSEHAYYQLEILQGRADNPDQRIADDLRMFAFTTLDLAFGLLSSVVTLVSFIGILWAISGPVDVTLGQLSFQIPGFMVWVAVGYALVGSVLTHVVGRPLIGLNFQQQRVEADLRFGLIRLRENSEGVALYGGEASERAGLESRIDRIRENWWQLMRCTKNLTFLTTGYAQLADIFPLLVAAPRYFSGAISLGVLTQIGNAFGQVQGSMSWFVDSYGSLASWKATVDRLLTFQEAMTLARSQATRGARISVVANGVTAIHADQLELALPDGSVLLPAMDLAIERGDTLLITGPTGTGKSTLFRALAGVWPFGTGRVRVPQKAQMLFLPQRPYLPIGSLREVVTYPCGSASFDDAQIRCVLTAAGLASFVDRLDDVDNWALLMSGGEQQRLAIARAILQQPEWLFLDEATAALDDASETQMYTLLRLHLPNTAIVSIAHRGGVAPFHARHLTLGAPVPRAAVALEAQTA